MVTNFAFLKNPISYEMVAKTKNSLPTGELCELSCRLLIFFFENFFQEYHQNVNQFRSRSDPTFFGQDLGLNWLQ